MNHPLIIEKPLSPREEMTEVLEALDFGFEPGDGSSEAQRDRAAARRDLVYAALDAVRDAGSDGEAQWIYMDAMARLANLNRRGVISGNFKAKAVAA